MKFSWLFFVLAGLSLVGCSSVPKGEYPRSLIDRPYSVPNDVVSASFGVAAQDVKSKDITPGATNAVKDEDDSFVAPALVVEQGITNSVSWVYPLGIRWGIVDSEKHTLGATVYTVLFYTEYSVEYWYRLNDKFSLRPFFAREEMTNFFYDDETQLYGLEVIYQATESLALSLKYGQGDYEGTSDFLKSIMKAIKGESQDDIDKKGDIERISAGAVYSMSDYWDIWGSLALEEIKLDDFNISTTKAALGFSRFY